MQQTLKKKSCKQIIKEQSLAAMFHFYYLSECTHNESFVFFSDSALIARVLQIRFVFECNGMHCTSLFRCYFYTRPCFGRKKSLVLCLGGHTNFLRWAALRTSVWCVRFVLFDMIFSVSLWYVWCYWFLQNASIVCRMAYIRMYMCICKHGQI